MYIFTTKIIINIRKLRFTVPTILPKKSLWRFSAIGREPSQNKQNRAC